MIPPSIGLFTGKIELGAGALWRASDMTSTWGCSQAIAVFDPHFSASDIPNRLIQCLARTGCALEVQFLPPGEPDTQAVETLRRTFRTTPPDLVIAIGGGSTMDAAKVARSTWHRDEPVQELAGFETDFGRPDARLICVPTTAGTASEVSRMAVISQAGASVKLRYRPAHMAADIALLDPELSVTLPVAATAESGVDALTHALESYVSRLSNPFSAAFALRAIEILWSALPRACTTPDDIEARQACLVASTMAGLAFNSSELGLVHAISAALGAQMHMRHGLANAVVLPEVMRFNQSALAPDIHAALARIMGEGDLAHALLCLIRRIGLTEGLAAFCPDLDSRALAPAVMLSGNIRTNPREVSEADAAAVVAAALARSP